MTVPKTPTTPFAGFSDPTFTPVPDELFDELLATLSGAEVKVLLYIIRRTYGFKKRSDRVSKSQLESGIQRADGSVVDHGTGLSRRAIRLAVDSLVARGVLIKHTHQSAEKGFEATEYSLHRRPEKAAQPEPTPVADPRVLSTQGLGRGVPKPLGRGVPIQETVKQERMRQETDRDPSKFRKGSQKRLTEERVEGRPEPAPDPNTSTDPVPLASLLQDRADAHGTPAPARPPEPSRAVATTEPQPAATSDAGAPSRYSHERQVILAYLRDFASEFHDGAPLRSSVTRALHLFERSGLSLDAFIGKLYEARALTKERDAAIGYHGRETPQRALTALRNKAPYFFAVLEDVLGFRAPAAEPEEGEGLASPSTCTAAAEAPPGAAPQPSRGRRDAPRTDHLPQTPARLPATADPTAVWQAALAELEHTVTQPIFETFLRGTGDAVRASGQLVVSVPSDFAAAWLDTKLRPVVQQALARVVGQPVPLRFVVNPPRPAPRSARAARTTTTE